MTENASRLLGLRALPRASNLLSPWTVTDLSVYPFGAGWWPFNPSIHRDPRDGAWRCVVRLANYTIPDGVPYLSPEARAGRAQTRNILLTLDRGTLAPTALTELVEPDEPPRSTACTSMGLEDLRLFRTAADGLLAVGCALQHNLEHPNRPEIVLCHLDEDLPPRAGRGTRQTTQISSVHPIRGPWGFRPQKNWVPFDGTERVRLLYSIERGVVMTEDGPAPGSPLPVTPRAPLPTSHEVSPAGRSGSEVRLFNRPIAVTPPRQGPTSASESRDELRGGSQLVALPDGRWLGIAHEMTFAQAGRAKFYWHTLYTMSTAGQLLERSPALRLSGDHGIEFAAGLAVDDDGRVALSFGTDDHQAWVATTRLEAVLAILRPAS